MAKYTIDWSIEARLDLIDILEYHGLGLSQRS